jgi:hypothetical protein
VGKFIKNLVILDLVVQLKVIVEKIEMRILWLSRPILLNIRLNSAKTSLKMDTVHMGENAALPMDIMN